MDIARETIAKQFADIIEAQHNIAKMLAVVNLDIQMSDAHRNAMMERNIGSIIESTREIIEMVTTVAGDL